MDRLSSGSVADWLGGTSVYQSSNILALHNSANIALFVVVEYDDWKIVLHAHRHCSDVHDPELQFDCLTEAELLVFGGVWILLGITGVDAIHLGCLQEDVAVEFSGPE